jgi:hypothetical protein
LYKKKLVMIAEPLPKARPVKAQNTILGSETYSVYLWSAKGTIGTEQF